MTERRGEGRVQWLAKGTFVVWWTGHPTGGLVVKRLPAVALVVAVSEGAEPNKKQGRFIAAPPSVTFSALI